MTEQTTAPNHTDQQAARLEADARLAQFEAERHRTEALLQSEAAQNIRRYLKTDNNGVTWGELVRELGGLEGLHTVLGDDGQTPDPEKLNPFIDRIFARTATRQAQGGMRITYGLRNR